MDRKDMVPGTIFKGHVNGAKMEIIKLECASVVIKDHFSGRLFTFGTKALEKCDVTVIEQGTSKPR